MYCKVMYLKASVYTGTSSMKKELRTTSIWGQKTRACHSFSGKEHLEVLPLSPEGDAIVSQGPIHTPHFREERQSGAEFHI